MRNTANTPSAAALIPSMAELFRTPQRLKRNLTGCPANTRPQFMPCRDKDRRWLRKDSEPVGLNDAERVVSIDVGW
jgi:hypothetical protein